MPQGAGITRIVCILNFCPRVVALIEEEGLTLILFSLLHLFSKRSRLVFIAAHYITAEHLTILAAVLFGELLLLLVALLDDDFFELRFVHEVVAASNSVK